MAGVWIVKSQTAQSGAAGNTNHTNRTTTMGDKSPKANQKKSAQKQVKASNSSQAKKQAAVKKP